jgi:signal transduction histidine kinase
VTDISSPDTLADLKPGNHLCCLYQTEEEHRAVLTLFLRQGLEQDEKVLCIVDSISVAALGNHGSAPSRPSVSRARVPGGEQTQGGPVLGSSARGSAGAAERARQYTLDVVSAETILNYLRDDGLEVELYLASGQLVFRTQEETYMREGAFNPGSMIALLRAETEQALMEGYSALRVTDEMAWMSQRLPGFERLVEYEARLKDFLPGSQCLVLYRYDRRRFDAEILLDVLRAHPVAMVGTEIYDNPYYIPPAECLNCELPEAELRHWLQSLAERKQVYEALRQQTRDLEERVKELNCLFAISRLVEKPDISQAEILQGIVELVPPGWQHPEATCARIILEDEIYATSNFRETRWKQVSEIVLQGEPIGTVEVCYLGEKPDAVATPFQEEEERLLNAVAERLGMIIERVRMRQILERRVEERTREIQRRRQVAEGLRDILGILNSNRSLDEILDYILVQTSQLLGAEAAAVYRLHREGELLSIQAARGLDADYVASANIPIGQSVTGRAVLEGQPVALSDVAAISSSDDLILDRQRQALLERLGSEYQALLAVPLKNHETFGAITLFFHNPRRFSDEETGLAVAFSDQVVLAIQNAQMRAQAEESAVAAERNRLARELHDSVTQILFSASLTAEVLPIVWARDRDEGQQALDEMRELTRGALAEMRTLLMELRPAALMKADIDDLLRQLAEGFIGRARVPVTITIEGLRPLPPDVKVALYRIAQEALNNIAKHAEATHVMVHLDCLASVLPAEMVGDIQTGTVEREPLGIVELRIKDDGCGFDVDRVPPDHLGLGIMRERAEVIGAKVTVESQPGHGTQVTVTWRNEQRQESHDKTQPN